MRRSLCVCAIRPASCARCVCFLASMSARIVVNANVKERGIFTKVTSMIAGLWERMSVGEVQNSWRASPRPVRSRKWVRSVSIKFQPRHPLFSVLSRLFAHVFAHVRVIQSPGFSDIPYAILSQPLSSSFFLVGTTRHEAAIARLAPFSYMVDLSSLFIP